MSIFWYDLFTLSHFWSLSYICWCFKSFKNAAVSGLSWITFLIYKAFQKDFITTPLKLHFNLQMSKYEFPRLKLISLVTLKAVHLLLIFSYSCCSIRDPRMRKWDHPVNFFGPLSICLLQLLTSKCADFEVSLFWLCFYYSYSFFTLTLTFLTLFTGQVSDSLC